MTDEDTNPPPDAPSTVAGPSSGGEAGRTGGEAAMGMMPLPGRPQKGLRVCAHGLGPECPTCSAKARPGEMEADAWPMVLGQRGKTGGLVMTACYSPDVVAWPWRAGQWWMARTPCRGALVSSRRSPFRSSWRVSGTKVAEAMSDVHSFADDDGADHPTRWQRVRRRRVLQGHVSRSSLRSASPPRR
jgi:hypothetical protein